MPHPHRITYTELVRSLDAGKIASLDIDAGSSIEGRWKGTSATGKPDFQVIFTDKSEARRWLLAGEPAVRR